MAEAESRIKDLPVATGLADTDSVVVDRAAGTGRATIAEVAEVMLGASDGSTPGSVHEELADHETRIAALEGGGGAGAGSVIWRWNETDTSEFLIAHSGLSPDVALSVVSEEGGPALAVTFPTKTSGDRATFVVVNTPDLVLSKDAFNRYRYAISFRVVGTPIASEWYGVGPAYLCSRAAGAGFYGVGAISLFTANCRALKVEGGVYTGAGATPSGGGLGVSGSGKLTQFRSEVSAVHAPASSPTFRNAHEVTAVGGSGNSGRYNDLSASAYYVAQLGAWGAGWGSAVLDSVGICFNGNVGGTAGPVWKLDHICVLRLPIDA